MFCFFVFSCLIAPSLGVKLAKLWTKWRAFFNEPEAWDIEAIYDETCLLYFIPNDFQFKVNIWNLVVWNQKFHFFDFLTHTWCLCTEQTWLDTFIKNMYSLCNILNWSNVMKSIESRNRFKVGLNLLITVEKLKCGNLFAFVLSK